MKEFLPRDLYFVKLCKKRFYLYAFITMKIGIIGLPNVGKSTLFKALTKKEILIANYPFATINPNVGVVALPDERVQKLSAMSKSKKTIPAIVEFYDIAGLVKGASEGQGLGNQFLAHIRETAAIVHVVRCFNASDILHVEESVNPLRDIDIINTELILKDFETMQKRMEKLAGEAKRGQKDSQKTLETLKKLEQAFNENALALTLREEFLLQEIVKELCLLTAKPQIYLFNGKESDVSNELKQKVRGDYVVANLGAGESVGVLIEKCYEILGLISFFTTGEDETRAWTIKKGIKAPHAAAVIHTDFEKKFIKAEVINWQKLLEVGSWQVARQRGWMRIEGKEYVVQDGDVIEFKV